MPFGRRQESTERPKDVIFEPRTFSNIRNDMTPNETPATTGRSVVVYHSAVSSPPHVICRSGDGSFARLELIER